MRIVVALGGNALLQRGEPPGGVEAVVDKDLTAALLAQAVEADALLLTDVEAVVDGYGTPQAGPIRRTTARELGARSFPAGSMGPKAKAVCRFMEKTGAMAAIGRLHDAVGLLDGTAGTIVVPEGTAPPGLR